MRILVIRFSSIGDIILTTPVLKKLREKYPNAKIDFLTLDKFKDSISGNKNIDNLILFDKEKYKGINGIYNFSKKYSGQYDIIIDLHSKIRSKLVSKFIGGKVYRYKKRRLWKTILVKLRLIKYKVDNTIVKNYFGALKELDINYEKENLEFNFLENDLKKVEIYNNFIVFATGASKNTKKWPKEYFGELGKILVKEFGKNIILIGSSKEFEENEQIREMVGNKAINLSGKLTLKESGALISKSDFIITNDSGPFHIARGVNSNSFVIFGPTDPNMFEFNKNEVLIYGDEDCSPCSLHGDRECPKGNFKCMMNLTPEDVWEIIKKNIG
ncbi:glycosyltransferase family 9 protein [Haliovirga abyssi]|uniref:LPS biosynthesis protein n=1 Tax=Haliovirga abyssi TaxID=2996794 RepID=A0AAU9DGM4_9FUSO|nr:glycosyltransferase family 9 protein [Haliovirga abyssi]BDU49844.1 LPS biosynthesis protein [Haliovirga abyssi]